MTKIYPVALRRLFNNPSGSPVVDQTLLDLARDPVTQVPTASRVLQLVHEMSCLLGIRRSRVIRDVLKTKGGRRMARKIAREIVRAKVSRQSSSTNALRRRRDARPLLFEL